MCTYLMEIETRCLMFDSFSCESCFLIFFIITILVFHHLYLQHAAIWNWYLLLCIYVLF